MKRNSSPRKIATPKDIVRLAQKVKWRDVRSPQGEVVEAKTIRQMFKYAAASLKGKKAPKRVHAAVN